MSRFFCRRWFFITCLLSSSFAQAAVEAGLDEAVKWKWKVSECPIADWGLPIPEAPTPFVGTPAQHAVFQGRSYEVRKGDALVLIAKKVGRSVAQIKAANGLKTDMIHIGDVLQIPTVEECIALGLPPELPKPKAKPNEVGGLPAPTIEQESLLLQVFLDRQNFSVFPIDGKGSPAFQKLVYFYQANRGIESVAAQALASKLKATTIYKLRAEDFRFIAPPKPEKKGTEKKGGGGKKGKAVKVVAIPFAQIYAELTSASMLAYRTPWEFLAERFHCDEELLKILNSNIKQLPAIDMDIVVPNVIPFEIEKAFALPLQPVMDSSKVMTAFITDVSRLDIYENANLIACLPVSSARPLLKGKGTWLIQNAIPRPRLSTFRELRDPPKPLSTFDAEGNQLPPPPPVAIRIQEEYLPAGPNNPVGILWINLAKADSPEPLSYGLHGTGVPMEMATQASIGGFRLANWDIARIVRMLPEGTPLIWKQTPGPPKTGRQAR